MTTEAPLSERAAADSRPLRISVAAGAVLVMFLWAICFPLIAVGLETSPPITLAAVRAVLSGVVLLAIARSFDRPRVAGGEVWVHVVLVGLTATSIGFFGMFYGGQRVSPGIATVFANTQPLIAAGLARIVLGERLGAVQGVALVVAFAGIALVAAPGASSSVDQTVGMLYILLAATGVAISNVALKRLAGRVDVLWAMGWQLSIGGLPLIVLALVVEDTDSIRWGIDLALSVSALSVLGTALPFVLWLWLLRHAALTRLNVFSFFTPIFGLLAGALLFDERASALQIAGVVLSLAGVYYVSRWPRPRPGGGRESSKSTT